MDLILWRHAEAGEPRETQDELDRGLTAKGERQAHRVAGWLGRHLPANAKVLVSPARCAQQTAAALDRKFKTLPELDPTGPVEQLLTAARWPDGRECVVIVGHQPALGTTAAYLLAQRTEPWVLRKGGLLWLRSREREGQQQIMLHAAVWARAGLNARGAALSVPRPGGTVRPPGYAARRRRGTASRNAEARITAGFVSA